MPDPLATTITWLEMTARPVGLQARPAPMIGRDIALMRSVEPPLHFYRYLYHEVGKDWVWVDRKRMADADLLATIHDDKVEVWPLYVGGCPAGYFELDFREAGVCDLAYLGLIGEFTGLRLGGWLLRQALSRAWDGEDVARVTINTCTLDHPRALPMYQKAGFRAVRRSERMLEPL